MKRLRWFQWKGLEAEDSLDELIDVAFKSHIRGDGSWALTGNRVVIITGDDENGYLDVVECTINRTRKIKP